MCYPNRSWIIEKEENENEKIFHLPNVQSHNALERFLGVTGEDREVYIPSLLEKKNIKRWELREREILFLRKSLKDFNFFVLDNPSLLYHPEFFDTFYDNERFYRNLLKGRFFPEEELCKTNIVFYHWRRGELPNIPTFNDVLTLLEIRPSLLVNSYEGEILSEYTEFNKFLRSFFQNFRDYIAPTLNEKRVRKLLHNLEV